MGIKRTNFTDQQIIDAVVDSDFNFTKAGKLLGVSRQNISNWYNKLWEGTVEFTNEQLLEMVDNHKSTVRAFIDSPPTNFDKYITTEHENQRILVISDMHIPYHHKDLLPFLIAIIVQYKPTRIVCIGDELDYHAMSFHTSDPDLDSASHELSRSRSVIKELENLFPKMDIVHSNHGSMVYRRGKEHGIPKHMLKSYRDVLGVGEGWQWHEDLTLELPNGQFVNFHHGRGANVGLVSRKMGMSFVQGHYHSKFVIDYWGNPMSLNWGMNVGCLIDDSSLAFAYNKVPPERPIIGLGMIIDSHPKLIPLVMNRGGDWTGELN